MRTVRPHHSNKGMTAMKSLIVKHSVIIRGHKTSVSLEKAFWNALKEIADLRGVAMTHLVTSIDAERKHANLSSAIRLFVLDHYRSLTASTQPAAQPAATVTKIPFMGAPAYKAAS
jgi:predicted DNA-binding ribbon-helix-helix protein